MHTQPAQLPAFGPLFSFARAQIRGQMRNWRATAAMLFTPMFLLILFKLTGDADANSLVPLLVGFGVMFSGQTLGLILITWRNNRVFTRLAATPTPIGHLLFATVIAQMIVFLLQSTVLMITGVMLYDVQLTAAAIPVILALLSVGCITFLSFGAMIAAFVRKVDTLSVIYMFTILPMIFLSGSIFAVPGLSDLCRWLPPALLVQSLSPYFGFGEANGGQMALNASLLLMYSGIFTGIAGRFFQTGE